MDRKVWISLASAAVRIVYAISSVATANKTCIGDAQFCRLKMVKCCICRSLLKLFVVQHVFT